MSSLPPDEPPRLRARERGRARRRLRFLRQVRELQLRDAGGFVFELYRFGEQRDELVRGKLDALIATDKEIRALETALGVSGGREIRQPGVGGACPECGAFHPRDARFCAKCGAPIGTRAEEPAIVEEPVYAEETLVAEEPALEEPPLDADPAPPEPHGEVTVVRGPEGLGPEALPEPSSNGVASTEDVAAANGQVMAEPGVEGVAPAPERFPES